MKDFFKTILINVALAIALFGSVLLIGAAYQDAVRLIPEQASSRSKLILYANIPWAETHFREFGRMETGYHDFIGWRRKQFSGTTINVNADGFRIVPGKSSDPKDASVHVFGGSTIWGSGADDNSTIPAFLAEATGTSTFNFGESAYVAHQSLNLLIKNYALGMVPDVVIFYDGVNDVSHKCRSENNFFGTSQEKKLVNLTSKSRLWRLFAAGLGLSGHPGVEDPYDCDTNPEKALQIADTLVLNWASAKLISESRGAKFIAILQPVSFLGKSDTSYLPPTDERLGKQFEVMYPLIRQRLAAAGVPYIDLTAAFDDGPPVYIDFCHLVPDGNRVVARRIADLL